LIGIACACGAWLLGGGDGATVLIKQGSAKSRKRLRIAALLNSSALITAVLWSGAPASADCIPIDADQTCTNSGSLTGSPVALTDTGVAQGLTLTNTNTGTISGTGGVGIGISANTASVTNFGTISGTGNGGGVGVGISTAATATVTNFGTISGTGTVGADGFGISATTATVTNYGTIKGTSTGGQGIGILATSPMTVTNYGTISGITNIGGSGFGIGGVTGNVVTNYGTITGTLFAILFAGGGNTLTLGPTSIINGTVVTGSNSPFQLGGTGNGSFDLSTIGPSAQYRGFDTFNVISGTWTVFNTFGQSQAWNVNGGTLAGTGTLKSVNVNNGGTLSPGTGPGTTMTISGNLAFQSGAFYLVQLNPTTTSIANVTGTASLAGTVQAVLVPGSYTKQSYDILHATGGLGGTTFNAATVSPPNFAATLSYTPTDVFLSLTAALGNGTPLNQNQQSVANAINAFFNNGGTLPPGFFALFNLTDGNLANALTSLSGEVATGAQQPAFQLMNEFLGIMLDPFVDGRAGVGGISGGVSRFAPDSEPLPEDIALAYSKVLRTPVYKALPFEQRWSVWGAGYGGANRTSGDPLVVGSHDLSAHTAGGAAGLDYRLAPGTIVGFALAGGGTGWSLAQNLGSGRGDAFQAGLYAKTYSGPFYLAGALAYTQHWMSTDRIAFAGDRLQAQFNAESFGGRAEAGYRIANPIAAITPYAAVQAQSFHTPTYNETDVTGGGFGLTYNAHNASDTRTELGARFDRPFLLNRNAVLALRARVAWAHDWITDPNLIPTFEALPGASFLVQGATPAKNSALTSAGAEVRLVNGVSVLAKFDGQFATHSQTYGGSGAVRYVW
jgi:outer membrane autotransporter protein